MTARDRVIHLTLDTYERLEREAERRGLTPDDLAEELLLGRLVPVAFDWDRCLAGLAQIRGRIRGADDEVILDRQDQDELERRGS